MITVKKAAYKKPDKPGFNPVKAVNKTSHEYAEAATVHGISYACDVKNRVFPRIIWTVIVLIFGKYRVL